MIKKMLFVFVVGALISACSSSVEEELATERPIDGVIALDTSLEEDEAEQTNEDENAEKFIGEKQSSSDSEDFSEALIKFTREKQTEADEAIVQYKQQKLDEVEELVSQYKEEQTKIANAQIDEFKAQKSVEVEAAIAEFKKQKSGLSD